ncbi:substrate-binding periplasmic protein [Spartinivicinus poritis]|uniref:Transporter substrate-binding domain-containing protein n=1 Tax=Spartinivicinus poritis TaxID=2994640 RepID=A0ABT5UCM8_9GAMM|nr:transporter substrate-binding domain-containing protein [Spartinivicinus sp. A2-2]MDE1464135.1 transporter substrate-binding domain-containing protein [Spartinivicinus sp. A2-2]
MLLKKYLIIYAVTVNVFASEMKSVLVGVDEWAPFVGQGLPENGIISKTVKSAFATKGVKVDFQWLPWKRVMFMTSKGDLDATPGWSRNKDREKKFLFSEQPILTESAHLFYKKGRTITWNEIADLKKYRFVGILGYNYQYLEDEGITIERVKTEKQALNMIVSSRADIFEANLKVGIDAINSTLDKSKQGEIEVSNKPSKVFHYYVLFPKTERGQEVKQIFDEGFKAIQH